MAKSKPQQKRAEKKEQIFLKRVCPFCPARVKRSYSSFQKVREHVASCKKIILLARNANQRKNPDHKYYTESDKENAKNILLCCPSCEETYDSKTTLKDHVLKEHVEIRQSSEPNEDTWNINGINITDKFTNLKNKSIGKCLDFKDLDRHFNCLLSISSIAVFQKRYDYQELSREYLSPSEYESVYKHLKETLIPKTNVDINIQEKLKKILKQFDENVTSCCMTKMEILKLTEKCSEQERSVLLGVEALVGSLKDLDVKKMGEMELSCSFIHPVIQGLFAMENYNIVSRCSNNLPDTAEENMRPDYTIDIYKSYKYGYTSLFGEIKTVESTQLRRIKDFYKLAIFCKEEMFKSNLSHILAFQAIGQTLTFYIMKEIHTIYVMIEIGKIAIPLSKTDNITIISSLDDMLVLSLLHKQIENNTNNPWIPTLPNEYVQYHAATLPKGHKVALGHVASN